MRWQRAARFVVAGVGLGTAVALVVLTRERPVVRPPVVTPGGDPAAVFQSAAGATVRHDGDRVVARVEYGQVRRYADRMEWEAFALTLDDGAKLSANRVTGTFTGANRDQPTSFAFDGDVRFQSAAGMSLEGDAGTYDDVSGTASIPGPAEIRRQGLQGRGTGGTYERSSGTFTLLADAELTVTPDGGEAPIALKARTITITGGGASMLLEQSAEILRASDTLRADRATVYFADQQQFRTIEMRGRSRVAPLAGKTSDLPDLQADDMELDFYPGGTALQRAALHRQATMVQRVAQGRRAISASDIRFATAPDGKTLTRLEASERVSVTLPASPTVAARTITGATLAASGNDQAGLTSAVFDGGVEFVEAASTGRQAGRRTGHGERLSLTVKGQLEAIDAAFFERDVRFVSGDVVGVGDLGDYRATKGELDLRPSSPTGGRRARVEDGAVIVEASERILVNLDTNDLYARGGVTTVSRAKSPGSRTSSAMFDGAQPLYGSGAEFWYDASTERFRYLGDGATLARLKQSDDSLVTGREVVFLQRTQELTASGQTESVFVASSGTTAAATRYRATGTMFRYDDASRTVINDGAPARLRFGTDDTEADRVVLTLAKEGRTVERMEATGNVRTNAQAGRLALADRVLYEPEADSYRLWGRPLTLWTRESDGTCTSQTGNFVRITGEVRAPEFPEADNPAGATSTSKLTCPPFFTAR